MCCLANIVDYFVVEKSACGKKSTMAEFRFVISKKRVWQPNFIPSILLPFPAGIPVDCRQKMMWQQAMEGLRLTTIAYKEKT